MKFDFCIIGGGIVGLATAIKLMEADSSASILVLEKELQLARHQSGHNSGVIHSGIYYAPGSLKAELCKRGAAATRKFCIARGVPFEQCGKLLVATDAIEMERMEALYVRSAENGIDVERLDSEELHRREPAVRGLGALFVASTGIVDYRRICQSMADQLREGGAQIELGVTVTGVKEDANRVRISAGERSWEAGRLIACAGLQSDRIARLAGMMIDYRIVPFRGEYFHLPAAKSKLVRSLIYPIPDPSMPFLGVHLTLNMDGMLTVGPNAVLGFAREGYPKYSFDHRDAAEMMRFPGFWKMACKNLETGLLEMRNSMWKAGYLAECQKYCPGLVAADLLPSEAGIRAQAVMNDGTLVHDFLFAETERMLHVCNAPSPAATSALPIGSVIVSKLMDRTAPPST